MDIAIFGGSFDPFHTGHEKIVNTVLKKLDIDKLFIIPTYLNPFKNSSFLDANTRLNLLNDLYKDNKNISIIDYEVKQNKKITSYETIQYIKKIDNFNKIYLIIGADNLKDIHLWYNFKNIKNEVQFIVLSRNNIPLRNEYIDAIYLNIQEDISSSKLRENLDINYIPKSIQKKVRKLWQTQ